MGGETGSEIAGWLAMQGLEKYAALFEQHEIGVAELPDLSEQHLQELGLPLGARLRLLKAVRQGLAPAPAKAAPLPPSSLANERRPVTMMFCDIVSSISLTAALEAETTRRVMLRYWRLVEQTAARYGGHIAQHLGDGALIYFGYPVAREDDAERSLLAGLKLLEEMALLETGIDARLQLRIGIATGTVVLNEFNDAAGSNETLAFGHAVNLASRLQSQAAPDSILIDGPTHDLVSGLFRLGPKNMVTLAGIAEPVAVFQVEGAAAVHSRFEARHTGTGSAFLGRTSELNLLLNRWDTALLKLGQLVLITGEPGIGKSRLLAEVAARVASAGHVVVQLQCSPHATGSPLQPVVDWLIHFTAPAAGQASTDLRAARLTCLRARLGPLVGDEEALLDLLAPSAALTTGDPQLRRAQTLDALAELFSSMAQHRPLLLVAEDLHWCDPTTLELFARLLARAQPLPLLLLATARPEFQHDFGRATSRTDLALPRLDRPYADALTRQVLGAQQISAQVLDMVAERADGVPLFVEELVRSLKESGALVHTSTGVALVPASNRAAIPRGLESTLMARVDRLGAAKQVAQVAACIGRVFTLDMLAQVIDMPDDALWQGLVAIVQSDLIEGDGSPPYTRYRFRHALVRDAAYNSLLLSERQPVHQRIAAILGAAAVPPPPQLLAHHLSAAQLTLPAIEKWCEAGEAAKQRSADAEAIEHLSQALRLVQTLTGPEHRERELAVRLALVAPLRSQKGFAAEEVAQLTAQALRLADDLNEARTILPLLYNNWVYTFVTAHRDRSEELARDMLARSRHDKTNLVRMTALRALAATQFTAGAFEQAAEHFDESIALYGLAAQADLTHAVGLDGRVTALGYNSLARWCLGDTATAHAHIAAALQHAQHINHISTTAFITYHQALLAGVLERDAAVLRANGSRLEHIGQEHRFEMWLICGRLLQSLCACLTEPSEDHIETAEVLFAEFEAMGVVYRPLFGTVLAEVCLRQGDLARGLGHVLTAKALMDKTGERWCEAEVYRMEGLLANGAAAQTECLAQALRVATLQKARSWQNRILGSQSHRQMAAPAS